MDGNKKVEQRTEKKHDAQKDPAAFGQKQQQNKADHHARGQKDRRQEERRHGRKQDALKRRAAHPDYDMQVVFSCFDQRTADIYGGLL